MGKATSLSVRLRRAPTQYRPISRIAVGGMAEVWKAEAVFENGESHLVAIKRVLPNMADPMFRTMFEDEARLGMQLHHPNIVRVYDARDIGGTYLMIMELVDGDTLKGVLQAAHQRNACMPLHVALHIARELGKALAYAHTATDEKGRPLGIVHRDVSPHNLLLGRDGSVKLTDFGLADATVNETVRADHLVGGKFAYLAPEIVHQRPVDHRIDLFAAGIILWEMLAGRRLFQAENERETVLRVARCEVPDLTILNPRVPEEVARVVEKLLAADPARRFATAVDFLEALDAVARGLGIAVDSRDVSLLVGLHLANRVEPEDRPVAVADLLAQELAQFAQAAQGTIVDIGAEPLDPSEFGGGASGARRRPRGP